ncbi:MAG TPA: pyridoxamine 5'-phosphate oxidase family protein [Candidatus Eisenbergiella merdavium]|uniref:Pyridoxamine 5'-phosphate oxidase family protein n=1 Tax=Candidatus Eisenbergiella merdavium TaxID=2838551 RepID=A0A9D2SPT5_9FIRM|nr:pyridoxamine 5'-phosphate oxidase family protein [Candidatus Eisenbergiella merdavium]
MRRSDREITESGRIDEIIRSCHCCRLGFCDGKDVYIVPLSFGYRSECGKRSFYFHCQNLSSSVSGQQYENYGIPAGKML